MPKSKSVKQGADELMIKGAETFRERNLAYGDSYKQFGPMMVCLFPKGVTLKTCEDFNRFGVLSMIGSKLMRYCNNFPQGGHQDSVHDLGVYSFMLEELDQCK